MILFNDSNFRYRNNIHSNTHKYGLHAQHPFGEMETYTPMKTAYTQLAATAEKHTEICFNISFKTTSRIVAVTK